MTTSIPIEELPGLSGRLRAIVSTIHNLGALYEEDAQDIGRAARTLESLAAENKRLREALTEVHAGLEYAATELADKSPVLMATKLTLLIRIARKALSGGSEG